MRAHRTIVQQAPALSEASWRAVNQHLHLARWNFPLDHAVTPGGQRARSERVSGKLLAMQFLYAVLGEAERLGEGEGAHAQQPSRQSDEHEDAILRHGETTA